MEVNKACPCLSSLVVRHLRGSATLVGPISITVRGDKHIEQILELYISTRIEGIEVCVLDFFNLIYLLSSLIVCLYRFFREMVMQFLTRKIHF